MNSVGLAIFRRFCRDPAQVPARERPGTYSLDAALATLTRVDREFPARVRGRRVVDFGCGHGHQTAAFLQMGAAHVLGLETSLERRRDAERLCAELGLSGRAEFSNQISAAHIANYDLVISQDAMEHYGDPAGALAAMRSLLKPGGIALVTFGPPWFAPYGAHHAFYSPLPWAHLLFGERILMAARQTYRHDGVNRYADVDGGLNQMSLRKFERLLKESGFRVTDRRYETVKKLPLLGRIPFLRELFVNHVTVWLAR